MSDNITITINGQEIETQPGKLLIDVADENDIVIPRFCYHKRLFGGGQLPHVPGRNRARAEPMPACATQCMDGMVVQNPFRKSASPRKNRRWNSC